MQREYLLYDYRELFVKIAYFDCSAGASGDMILGAMVDAGLDPDALNRELARLRVGASVRFTPSNKNGLACTQAVVDMDSCSHPVHRHLSDIRQLIHASDLSAEIKERSVSVFTRLAQAEAKVHGTDVEAIHFHEVGAVDAIMDVVGAVAGLSLLGIEAVYCSALHVGSGSVRCHHGVLPVPAPAVLELVKGVPVYSTGVKGELLTPTGAAVLTTLARQFGAMPPMLMASSGCGSGTSDFEIPNVLRIIIGDTASTCTDYETDQVVVLETAIDDMNPQLYDHILQKALDMGALDIFLTPVHMKKNRPGVLVTLLCRPEECQRFSQFLMSETTSIGVRWRTESRIKARREIRTVPTSLGAVHVKTAWIQGRPIHETPEYEDCKAIALKQGLPLKVVMDRVLREMSHG